MSQKAFLLLFNDLEQLLQEEYGVEEGAFQLMERAKLELGSNPIKQHWEVLDIARRLRNILVHETSSQLSEIATPSADIMATLEKVVDQYRHPFSIRECLDKKQRTEVVSFSTEQTVADLLAVMKRRHYSQFPLFDRTGYVGVISAKSVVNWLAHSLDKDGQLMEKLTEVPLRKIATYRERNKAVACCYKEDNLFRLLSLFEHSRVKVVLVCEKESLELQSPQDIVGILTSHDVAMLRAEVER